MITRMVVDVATSSRVRQRLGHRSVILAGIVGFLLGAWPTHAATAEGEPGGPFEFYSLYGVASIVVQPDGRIVVANGGYPSRGRLGIVEPLSGKFGILPGGIFRFHPDGSLDHGFVCQLGPVSACDMLDTHIALQTDGRLLVQGEHGELVRLLPDGSLDGSFSLQPAATNAPALAANRHALKPFIFSTGGSIAVLGKGAGKLKTPICGAGFCSEIPYRSVHHFSPAGQFLSSSESSEPGTLIGVLFAEGLVLCTPCGLVVDPLRNTPQEQFAISGQAFAGRGDLKPLEKQFAVAGAAEAVSAAFQEVPVEMCRYAVRLADGATIVAVGEPAYPHRGRFMRFDSQWQVDWSYTNHFERGDRNRFSARLAADGSGRLLVTGNLTTMNGEPFTGIARLLPDGTTDLTFRARVEGTVALAVQPDGRVLVGGSFRQINGVACANFARLNSDGSLDTAFHSYFDPTRFRSARLGTFAHRATDAIPLASGGGPAPAQTNSGTSVAVAVTSGGSLAGIGETIRISKLEVQDANVEIEFVGGPAQVFVLQTRNSWNEGQWLDLSTNVMDAKGLGSFTDEGAARRSMRFYRLRSP